MLDASYFIEEIDKATKANSNAKQVCNGALNKARGRIMRLETELKWKDRHIEARDVVIKAKDDHINELVGDIRTRDKCVEELESEVRELRETLIEGMKRDLEDIQEKLDRQISEVTSGETSGSVTDGCEDRWIPCSERLPEGSENVLIKIKSTLSVGRYFTPRTGYCVESDGLDTHVWFVWGDPGSVNPLPVGFDVIAWQPLPEDYVEPEVGEPVEEEAKFEVGDFVLCVSKAGVKINAVYLREDEEYYWILDKSCLTQQPLDKNHWKLTKYPGYMSVVDWLTKL